jgi:hypothetical protein
MLGFGKIGKFRFCIAYIVFMVMLLLFVLNIQWFYRRFSSRVVDFLIRSELFIFCVFWCLDFSMRFIFSLEYVACGQLNLNVMDFIVFFMFYIYICIFLLASKVKMYRRNWIAYSHVFVEFFLICSLFFLFFGGVQFLWFFHSFLVLKIWFFALLYFIMLYDMSETYGIFCHDNFIYEIDEADEKKYYHKFNYELGWDFY